MTTSYRAGTVSVSAGARRVTGVSTGWVLANISPGYFGLSDGQGSVVPVEAIVSDTELDLFVPWSGPSLSGQEYWLSYDTRDGQQTVNNAQRLAEYVARLDSDSLSAISGLSPSADKFIKFTGEDTATLVDASEIGGGDVKGPDGSVSVNQVAGFADETGKLLKALTPEEARDAIGAGNVSGPTGGATAGQIAGFSGSDGGSISPLTAAQVRSYARVQTGGLRNKIINPLFNVNQRGVSGTVTLAAFAFGHDRFRAGASGCTYTFSTNNGVTSLNITAGSLQQIIEANQFSGEPGEYVLSWLGTSQGRISGGSYGSSGNVSATINGGSNVVVEFNSGSLSLVQFERDYVTSFSGRSYSTEVLSCFRYYFRGFIPIIGVVGSGGTSVTRIGSTLLSPMRAAPSASVAGQVYDGSVAATITGIQSSYHTPTSVEFDLLISPAQSAGRASRLFTNAGNIVIADSELS